MKTRLTIHFCLLVLLCGFVLMAGCLEGGKVKVRFVSDVKPILEAQCVRCHNDETLMGGLNLMNRERAMQGSAHGPILTPGRPENSPLYRATLDEGDPAHAMPATGPKLTERDREILRQWIKQGAEWPEGPDGAMTPIRAALDEV